MGTAELTHCRTVQPAGIGSGLDGILGLVAEGLGFDPRGLLGDSATSGQLR
jgi:hypothetical protein